MKKALAGLLTLSLLISIFFFYAQATDTTPILSSKQADVKQVVKAHLSDCTDNMYLYESNDIKANTILGTSAGATKLNKLPSVKIASKEVSLTQLRDNMSFMEDKVEYFKYIRSEQEITRSDFNVSYQFDKINLYGDSAVVNVYESITFNYIHDPALLTDSTYTGTYIGTEYTVELVQSDEEWLIVNVDSDDPFDGYKIIGFDLEAEKELFDEAQRNPSSTVTTLFEAPAMETRGAVTNTIPYDRGNAAKYAFTYTTSAHTSDNPPYDSPAQREFYNKLFTDYATEGTDCMNFASQCVWAGLGGSNDATDIGSKKVPMDNDGSSNSYKWYGQPNWASTSSWVSCSNFRTYIANSIATTSDSGLVTSSYSVGSGAGFSGIYDAQTRLVGSVMHVNSNNHAIVINRTLGTNRNQAYFCAHTSHRKDVLLSEFYSTGAITVIIPEHFREISTCTGSSHTYSDSTDATCNTCGYNRLYVRSTLHNPQPVYSTVTLGSTANIFCNALTIRVYKTNNERSSRTLYATSSTSSGSNKIYAYTFNETGLYEIVTTAVAVGATVTHSCTIRIY